PDPPISLTSKEWAADFNELKDYGGKTSAKRSVQQTEIAQFWLMVGPPAYQPFARNLVMAKQMNVDDSARFMALVAVGLNEALIAVFDANTITTFGGRLLLFATVISTTTRLPTVRRPGSQLIIRRCIRSIRARIVSSAAPLRVS